MFESTTQIRVRYGETDQMKFVYYGNYALYYEVARTEAMRSLGFPYARLEETGILLPVVEMQARYLGSAHYDDLLTIKTYVREMPDRFITFESDIYNTDGKLINQGRVRLIFYNPESGRPTRIHEQLKTALAPYFKDTNHS